MYSAHEIIHFIEEAYYNKVEHTYEDTDHAIVSTHCGLSSTKTNRFYIVVVCVIVSQHHSETLSACVPKVIIIQAQKVRAYK